MTKHLRKGTSLFELLITIMVIGITLIAIIGLVSTSVSNNTLSNVRTLAARFTGQGVEWLRAERDRDWGEFIAKADANGQIYCLQELASWPAVGSCTATQFVGETILTREAELIYNPSVIPDTVEARVVTRWNDSDGVHESRASTFLTNWRTK